MRLKISNKQILILKILIHFSALTPLIWTYYEGFTDALGGDPVEAILHFTGIGAFNLLLISLAVSPIAKYFRAGMLIKVRRVLGLYAFAYAFVHFASYILFELQLEWQMLLSEIIKRPYITVGFVAIVILSVLAATSTKKAQRALGQKWQKIHNWVYLAAILIALHYIWSVKSDIIQPLIYWLLLLVLLYFRFDKIKKIVKRS